MRFSRTRLSDVLHSKECALVQAADVKKDNGSALENGILEKVSNKKNGHHPPEKTELAGQLPSRYFQIRSDLPPLIGPGFG